MAKSFSLRQLPKRLVDATLMQPWVAGPLHIFGNEMPGKSWIFIVGCYNSGTTLLAELLQTHPELDGLRNEGAFLTDQLPYPERFGWPRMWSECADMLRVPHDDLQRARRIKRHWSLWVKGKSDYIVEKSISNTLRMRFLEENFENAKFVHIVRNGLAVSAGIQKKANLVRWKNPEGLKCYPIDLCARQWSESINVVDVEVARGAPVITVRYEDIAADPVSALRPVFDYIGVEAISDPSVWGKMQVHEKSSTIRDMNKASIASLTKRDDSIIRQVAGENLKRFGYW
jgi:hypothetical protein